MNILLLSFIFSPNIGGVESHLDDLCTLLAVKGYNITVITYQPLLLARNAPYLEKKRNLEIRRIPWFKFNLFNRLETLPILQFLYIVPAIFVYSFFYLLFNRDKIHVIQTHGFNMAFVGAMLSAIFQIPFTVNMHVSFYYKTSMLYSKILLVVLSQAKSILVLTHETKKELVKIGVKKEKIVIYRQWIDTNLFKPKDKLASRKKLNLPTDKFIVSFAGRFASVKGIQLLLAAAIRVNREVLITFVGSGELADSIIAASKKSSNIRFIGQIDRQDLPYYYSCADICIIPSTPATKTYSEGIPRVMIEALSCGVPIVTTKTGGAKELILSDIGFFIKPDSTDIAKSINTLVSKRWTLAKMRLHCIAYAKKEFELERNIAIIERSLL